MRSSLSPALPKRALMALPLLALIAPVLPAAAAAAPAAPPRATPAAAPSTPAAAPATAAPSPSPAAAPVTAPTTAPVPPPSPPGGSATPTGGGLAEIPAVPSSSLPEVYQPIYVEQLPGSAYPEPKVRGLAGGSLWLTFHGLQWPYYPKTGVGASGSVWIDTGYEQITRENRGGTVYWLQQGRGVLRFTPTYTSGSFFIQGQVELVGNKDQRALQPAVADTDDLWVRAGQWKAWDVQLGRYEPWELYHLGMGLDLNTIERQGAVDNGNLPAPPDFYGLWGYLRPSGYGNAALHLYAGALTPKLDFLRLELLGHFGYEVLNVLGGRPTLVLDFGWVKLKWGALARVQRQRDARVLPDGTEVRYEKWWERAQGAAVQFVLAPHVEFGVNGTYGLADHNDATTGGIDALGSNTIWSLGGFANFRFPVGVLRHAITRGEPGAPTSLRPLMGILENVLIGVGANLTDKVDLQRNPEGNVGHQTNLQAFAAIQYRAAARLYVKLVGAYARARWENLNSTTNQFENEMWSARLRLMYLF